MSEVARVYGNQRGGALDGASVPFTANAAKEQLIAHGLPRYTELSRRGLGWQVMDTSATAAVVVRPGTTAGLTLYNGSNASTGYVYVIDRVGAFNLVTTDAIEAWGIWGCVHPTMAAPTADITAIKSYSGVAAYAGNAIVDTGATVTDHGWFIMSTNGVVGNTSTTTPGNSICYDTDGRFLIPPGGGFSINVVATVTGQTFTHMISWWEIPIAQLPLES